MPTFTPPTTDGIAMADPAKTGRDPAHRMWNYHDAWAMGKTVWKNAQGVWHAQLYPYLGGSTTTVHDGGTTTITGPDEGLATALEVYDGGHVHPISDAKAAELIAAGFVVGGHLDDEEALWVDYAVNSQINKAYKGGDNCASLDRGDGTSLWVFADNLIGTLQAGGIYNNVLPVPNAFFTRTGDVLTQLYPEGNPPAWTNPEPGNWWWAFDLINDGAGVSGGVFVVAWEMTSGGPNHTVVCNELIELNAFGGVFASHELTHSNDLFHLQSICKDDTSGYHYLAGTEYDVTAGGHTGFMPGDQTFVRLARCPIGSLASVATEIEYWTGTAWADQPGPRLVDAQGSPIRGAVDLTKSGDTWVLMVTHDFDAALTLYSAPSPEGPWTKYHTTDNLYKPPTAGAVPASPAMYAYYQPKFHEHMSPAPGQLVASYSRNIFTVNSAGGGPSTNTLHVSTFTPQFVYLPAPES